jgi:RNA recognition motif-containing protein
MEPRTIFVGNLPREVTEHEIRARFGSSGEISDVRFPHRVNATRAFCFITFATPAQAQEAITTHNRSDFNGSPIDVELSRNPAHRSDGRWRRDDSPRERRRRARDDSSDSDSDERPRSRSRRRSRVSSESDSDSDDSARGSARRHRSNRRESPRRGRERDRDRGRTRDRDRDRRGSRRRSRSASPSARRGRSNGSD